MSEAARAAAGEHEADGLAAQQAREPRQVAIEPAAQVHVAGDRAPRKPLVRAARDARVGRMQQHEDLRRLDARRAALEAGLLRGVHRGRLRGVGQQQDLVAVTHAAARPRTGRRVGDQQHEVAGRLDLVERGRDGLVAGVAFGRTGALLSDGAIHRRRVEDADAPEALEMRQQFGRERARGYAIGDRQHADDDRRGQRTALVLRLQSTDDLARQRQRDLRAQREQSVELRLVELHEDRVAHRDDRRGARFAGEQAHLADHLAAADLADHPLGAALVAHVDAQPATEHQVAGVARLPLLHQHVAAGEFHPLHVLAQVLERHRGGVAEQPVQLFSEQHFAVGCGSRHRSVKACEWAAS